MDGINLFRASLKDASGEADLETKHDLENLEVRLMAELNLMRWMLGVVLAIAIADFAKQFFQDFLG